MSNNPYKATNHSAPEPQSVFKGRLIECVGWCNPGPRTDEFGDAAGEDPTRCAVEVILTVTSGAYSKT